MMSLKSEVNIEIKQEVPQEENDIMVSTLNMEKIKYVTFSDVLVNLCAFLIFHVNHISKTPMTYER